MTAYLVSKKVLKNNSADGKKKFSFYWKKTLSKQLKLYRKPSKTSTLTVQAIKNQDGPKIFKILKFNRPIFNKKPEKTWNFKQL